jgi:hypothetical protein
MCKEVEEKPIYSIFLHTAVLQGSLQGGKLI